MNVGGIIHGYKITGVANGYVMGKSVTAPNPYVVWRIDHDGNGVCCGHYFNDCGEAEYDFCARAFEWFADYVNTHKIEDRNCEGDRINQDPLEQTLIGGLKKIKADLAAAAQLIDEMCAEVERLRKERHSYKNNN